MSDKHLAQEDLQRIVSYGALAPSGDNCQPWLFTAEKDGTEMEALLDVTRDPSPYNVGQMASLVAVGAAIENMRQATAALYSKKVTWQSVGDGALPMQTRPVAKLKIGEAIPAPHIAMLRALEQRQTHRGRFESKPLNGGEREVLEGTVQEIGAEFPEVRVQVWSGEAQRAEYIRLVGLSDPLLFDVVPFRRHLFHQIRWNDPKKPLPEDGMPIATLNAGFMDRMSLRMFSSSETISSVASTLGAGKIFGDFNVKLAKASSVFVAVIAESPTVPAVLRAGAAMEKIWLAGTAAGLCVQPLTSPMIHTWRKRHGDMSIYTTKQAACVEHIAESLTKLCAVPTPALPVMILRIGRAQPLDARCGRRPVSEILSFKDSSVNN
jgi:hypothetical protein